MSSEIYSAAALAAAAGVPRTTINDWLTKYADFVECVANGKRKVYSARTLMVMQEIVRLRDAGKSGSEIYAALEQLVGVNPEVSLANTISPAAPAEDVVNNIDRTEEKSNGSNLPAIKKFEENAMELAAFIAELRKEQQQARKRANITSFMLFLVIVVLVIALGASVQAVRMQFAERQLEAVNTRKTLEKLNNDFTAEFKAQEKLRQQERLAAEKTAAILKDELLRQQQERAAETARLKKQLADDRAAWEKEMLRREKAIQQKSAAERTLLIKKMQQDAQQAQARFDAVKNELKNTGNALNDLNKKLQALQKVQQENAAKTVVPAAEKPSVPQLPVEQKQ